MLTRMRSGLAHAVLAALVLLALGPAAGTAQEEPTSGDRARRTHAIARDLMSPFCPGRTLADCPSPDAAAVRQEIRDLVDAGVADAEIRTELEGRFGDAVQGVPRSVWGRGLPILVLLAGAAALVWALRRMARRAPGPAPAASARELESQLDRELREKGL
jgi:cytochrome c-type biogenesis protein CcmH/NrfF